MHSVAPKVASPPSGGRRIAAIVSAVVAFALIAATVSRSQDSSELMQGSDEVRYLCIPAYSRAVSRHIARLD